MDEEEAKSQHDEDERSIARKTGNVTYSNAFVGYSVVLFGVLILSLDALMIDEVKTRGLDDWALLFYRYLLSTSTIFFFMTINPYDGGPRNIPKKFERIGYTGLFASCFWAVASITYTLAIEHTHVANVMIIMATTSLWTALFSSFIFYEVLPLRLIVAIVVSFLAVSIVVGLSMTLDEDWEGNLCAVSGWALLMRDVQ
jgi:drug/metabolite transporter (DMT)-like permease